MPLFVCSKCKCVENTALCNFWFEKDKKKAKCSECDNKIGKWHNIFSKEKWNGKDRLISL